MVGWRFLFVLFGNLLVGWFFVCLSVGLFVGWLVCFCSLVRWFFVCLSVGLFVVWLLFLSVGLFVGWLVCFLFVGWLACLLLVCLFVCLFLLSGRYRGGAWAVLPK